MPTKPKRFNASDKTARQEYDERRGTAHARGYTKQWGRNKTLWLQEQVVETGNPWCRYCEREEATFVDHAKPPLAYHREGTAAYDEMFWDTRFWIPACRDCNTRKGQLTPQQLAKSEPAMYLRLVVELAGRGVQL